MYAVGRLSSYITRGVSTVSGPFHPFGGAIDIVVVQQQDGSLKSSPWYVRFGKFQGVLKARERVVDINVNGVEADFHMYLNPRGEAYFLRKEIVSDQESRSGEADRDGRCLRTVKSKSLDYNFDHCNSLTDVNNTQPFSRNLGFVLERKNMKNEDGVGVGVGRKSADSAEIAADLLEMKWSTSLSSSTKSNKNLEQHNKDDDCDEITGGKLEGSLVLHEEHFVNKSSSEDNKINPQVDEVMVTKVDKDGIVEIYEGHGGNLENGILKEESLRDGSNGSHGQETVEEPLKLGDGCLTEVACIQQEKVSEDVKPCNVVAVSVSQVKDEVKSPSELNSQLSISPNLGSDSSPSTFEHEIIKDMKGNLRRCSSDTVIAKSYKLLKDDGVPHPHPHQHTKSLPNLCVNFYEFDSKQGISKWDILRKDASRIIKDGDKQPCEDTKSKDHKNNASGKSWSLWPFNKTRSKRFTQDIRKDSEFGCGSEVVEGEKDPLSKSQHKMRRELTPTPQQLESLNLTEGKNTVTFKFSTAVLGNQQVDARIFLWKWDSRIVISDVDGTITKSDVLGQFMPLVGRDWSHIGVTHLFSAIKENGYEILFLSARSISQADITRQFLINLRQEGKALPEGPVVISPDGLFPSLFREVIRRAPHEFKIACLADIRACFPDDWNPFYAGFGNRDTDEFSYLKVGIPKGKIFIINPKGEVVVNRCHDTKSYSSLHSIVNGIFPPKSEPQEVNLDKIDEIHSPERGL
ncbi:phosphatidate phosphatase PAH2 isoform X2 [Lactuca sativa]|uniref:phosphatidate phosphatase PAH2 isoform X2 n=1 Tax=Lactuca sativa TaxID=4236 RepID=UPI0022AFC285|nr:phosphatidate phosphatase PAH2 isoform X2 [Lactuca sativa]